VYAEIAGFPILRTACGRYCLLLPVYSMKTHKSGFVNIIGCPNVGKSTLMNALVGEKISIITSKAQTTRHRIMGIVSGEDFQIVYSDTPGVLKPRYKLQESMMKFVGTALVDADVILLMTDVFEDNPVEEKVMERIKSSKVPVLLLINKIDLIKNEEQLQNIVEKWGKEVPNAEIISLSALQEFNTDKVFKRILELLPEGEAFYPKTELTDKPEKFFVSETIREKILRNYHQEIPYSVEVGVESFKEDEKIIRIRAEIYVSRESQKAIIIGHQGQSIKKVGVQSRKDLETFFGKQIHLELFVKVDEDWRDNPNKLRRYGYE
jgi:GTP-binding protein Era